MKHLIFITLIFFGCSKSNPAPDATGHWTGDNSKSTSSDPKFSFDLVITKTTTQSQYKVTGSYTYGTTTTAITDGSLTPGTPYGWRFYFTSTVQLDASITSNYSSMSCVNYNDYVNHVGVVFLQPVGLTRK